ncbi:MAG TPA: T9SS type A sorting domain-containing protein, partial [Flavobacteriales bacterium]|nr:T9SS type A sorting domain-containing protein [Flavobacteriales bacterium]
TDEFTTFDVPAGYLTATFTSVSDNGVAVGYAQQFGEFGSLLRDAIIYHPSLGNEPRFLREVLLVNGLDVNAPNDRMGTAIAISPNGEYVAGWDDQSPFAANGWVVYFDGLLLETGTDIIPVANEEPIVSIFPNPGKDLLTISSAVEVLDVTLFNAQGQVVMQETLASGSRVLNIAALSNGVYTLRVTTGDSSFVRNVVKE